MVRPYPPGILGGYGCYALQYYSHCGYYFYSFGLMDMKWMKHYYHKEKMNKLQFSWDFSFSSKICINPSGAGYGRYGIG